MLDECSFEEVARVNSGFILDLAVLDVDVDGLAFNSKDVVVVMMGSASRTMGAMDTLGVLDGEGCKP